MRYAGLGLTVTLACSAMAASGPGGLLGSLTEYKDFTAERQSSHDPSGGNADGRQDWPIQPGETREMAVIEGPGAITHIWVTIASKDPSHLKNLVLRMYWDGEESPSVEAPIGDFFGLGHAKYYQYCSLPIQIGTSNALNCFWRMPFSRSARVTVTNDGSIACGAFYYYVDYQALRSAPVNTPRFHAQYRQQYPCAPGQNYTFLETQGRGHYVGVSLSIHNRADGWWGEGDDMIYVDGEEAPSLYGTGSEDYFCGAWCYGPAFSNPYFGCPLRGEHASGALWNVYRYHLEDPVPFQQSIKVTMEHGHANDRNDDFSSVAFWYQSEPHAPFPALPAAAERLPESAPQSYHEAGAIEAESLINMFQDDSASVQEMSNYADKWSDNKHVWFRPDGPHTYTLPLELSAPEAAMPLATLWYTCAPDYGTVEMWVNGAKAAEWDGYNADGVVRKSLQCPLSLKEGANVIEVRITGKNEQSSGFMAGIDCIRPDTAK
jgi:hypothetical protein